MRARQKDSPRGWVTAIGENNGLITGYNQGNSFYGITTNAHRTFTTVHYSGDSARSIPNNGIATYYGRSARQVGGGEAIDAGNSALMVDFGNKTIAGGIAITNGADIFLASTRLRGAEFSGKAALIADSDLHKSSKHELRILREGAYQGLLVGDNASHVVGVADFGSDELNTAFGGERR